jgi:prevent-host-death family protein
MFLKEISSSVAQRQIGKLFNAAYRSPVLLTRLNHEDVVVMSKAKYAKLVKSSTPKP